MDTDWGAITAELVRGLRGDRSREAFARRVGASANAIYAWETQRRVPTARAVFDAASRLGLDPRTGVAALLGLDPGRLDDLPRGIVEALRGSRRTQAIAADAGLSRFAISRWASGRATPRMPDLLAFVQAASWRALDLLSLLFDPTALPSARPAWASIHALRVASAERPWVIPVELALALTSYRALPRHDDAWIAQRLDLPVEEVQACVALLVDAGRARWEGAHLVPAGAEVVQIASPLSRRRLKAWCSRVAEEHLRGAAEGLYNSSVFAVSDEARRHLEEMHRDYVVRLRAYLARTAPGDQIMVSNVQLFPMS